MKWIKLSKKDRIAIKKQAIAFNKISKVVKFFNLPSDKIDGGGKFAEMSHKQVLEAGEKSGKFIKDNFSKQ